MFQPTVSLPSLPPIKPFGDTITSTSFPFGLENRFGHVRAGLPAPSGADAPTVLHIQDVHMNLEAQRNIAGAIENLVNENQVDLIALEGAFAPIDLAKFRNFRRPEIIRVLADFLLETGGITGPIYAALTVHHTVPFVVGIDDRTHYNANVRAYRDSRRYVSECKDRLAAIKQRLDAEKIDKFSPALLDLDQHVAAYRAGQLTLRKYLEYLAGQMGTLPPSLRQFLLALSLEEKLNFSQAERERQEMLTDLAPRLEKAEMSELLRLGVQTSLGRTGPVEFYSRLKSIGRRHRVNLSSRPALSAYAGYLEAAEKISVEQVRDDMERVARALYAQRATPHDQRLVDMSELVYLRSKLIEFSLTNNEWSTYKRLAADADVEVVPHLANFEAFYREAEKRDALMTNNLLAAMKILGARRVVLVTGGFHSLGMDSRLHEAGVTTVSFTPKISKVDINGGPRYLNQFLQEKSPLDRLFRGERLFLSLSPTKDLAEAAPAAVALSGAADAEHFLPRERWRSSVENLPPDSYRAKYRRLGTLDFFSTNVATDGKRVLNIATNVFSPVRSVAGTALSILHTIPELGVLLLLGTALGAAYADGNIRKASPPLANGIQGLDDGNLFNLVISLAVTGLTALIIFYLLVIRKPARSPSHVHTIPASSFSAPVKKLNYEINTAEALNKLVREATASKKVVVLSDAFLKDIRFPLEVSLADKDLLPENYGGDILAAVIDMFQKQSRVMMEVDGEFKPSFRSVEPDSSVIYIVYRPGQHGPKLYKDGIPPKAILAKASLVCIINIERALRPNPQIAIAHKEFKDNEGRDLDVDNQEAVPGYFRVIFKGNHVWWLRPNLFPIYSPNIRRAIDDQPFHMTAVRADPRPSDETVNSGGTHQKDMTDKSNMEDLFNLLLAINRINEPLSPTRAHVIDVVSQLIKLITSKGDSFNMMLAPSENYDRAGEGFRIGMNGWTYPAQPDSPMRGSNETPGKVKAGASQIQTHVQLYRFPQPAEKDRKKLIFTTDGTRVSYFGVNWVFTIGRRRITFRHPIWEVFLRPLSWIWPEWVDEEKRPLCKLAKEAGGIVIESSEFRVYIVDRTRSVPVDHLTNEFGYPEPLRLIVGHLLPSFFNLTQRMNIMYAQTEDRMVRYDRAKEFLHGVVESQVRSNLPSEIGYAISSIRERWDALADVGVRLKGLFAPEHPSHAVPKTLLRGNRFIRIINRIKRIGLWSQLNERFWKEAFEEDSLPAVSYESSFHFINGRALDKHRDLSDFFRATRTKSDVAKLLEANAGKIFSIEGSHRLLDGGSVLDIRKYQEVLGPNPDSRRQNRLVNRPTVTTLTLGGLSFRVRFEKSANPNAIEYVNIRRGYTPEHPFVLENRIETDRYSLLPIVKDSAGKEIHSRYDHLPAYVLGTLFGITGGVRVTVEDDFPMSNWGGMESSSLFTGFLVAGASMLAGADNSLGDVFKMAVHIENTECGNITGGQGLLATFIGVPATHAWLGSNSDRYPISVRLLSAHGEDVRPELENIGNHLMLVQAGVTYKDGHKEADRLAALINQMWLDLLTLNRTSHLYQEKKKLAADFAVALKRNDFTALAKSIRTYTKIRDELCRFWMTLLVDDDFGKDEELQVLSKKIKSRVHSPEDPNYGRYAIVREVLKQDDANTLKTMSLYTYGPIGRFIKRANLNGIAVFPIGAGGPSSNLILISPEGKDHIKKFLALTGMDEMKEDDIQRKMTAPGINEVSGYLNVKVGNTPFRVNGFQDIGPVPRFLDIHYNQITGAAIPDDTRVASLRTLTNILPALALTIITAITFTLLAPSQLLSPYDFGWAFLLSMFIHEAGHYVVMRMNGKVEWVKSWRVIGFRPLSNRSLTGAERLSGPVPGLIAAFVLTALALSGFHAALPWAMGFLWINLFALISGDGHAYRAVARTVIDEATLRRRARDLVNFARTLSRGEKINLADLQSSGEHPDALPLEEAVEGPKTEFIPRLPSFGACASVPVFFDYVHEELLAAHVSAENFDVEPVLQELEKLGLPVDDLRQVLGNLPRQKKFLVVPVTNSRSYDVAQKTIELKRPGQRIVILAAEGYSVGFGGKPDVETHPLNSALFDGNVMLARNLKLSLPEEYRTRFSEISMIVDRNVRIDAAGISEHDALAHELAQLLFMFVDEDGARVSLIDGELILNLKALADSMRSA